MSQIYYEAKDIMDRMNAEASKLPEDDPQRVLIELVEPLMLTEFSGRIHDEDFVEEVLEAYAIIPKILASYDPSKGTKLSSWGWRLMRNAVLKFVQKADRRYGHEFQMDGWAENDVYDVDNAVAVEKDAHFLVDTGWFGEKSGTGERAMEWSTNWDLFYRQLDDREQAILDMLMDGHTQSYIASALNLSQSRVSRLVDKIKEKGEELA